MRICLVSAFPPSHERINEYGYHLAHELQRNPFLSLTVLADEYDGDDSELPDFDVVRCWRPDSLRSSWTLLNAIRRCDPEVVWFNLVFSTFGGRNPIAAFLGLCIPMLARLMGYSTHVTLHHLIETLDLKGAGIRHPLLYRSAGWLATRMLLLANSVTVLLPDYRKTLLRKYRGSNVHLRAHGIFASNPEPPDFSMRGNPAQRILAFGKWGTYKRVEILLDAFEHVAKRVPNVELIIAGENHPNAPGYVESLRAQYGERPNVTFVGYVAEDAIPALFKQASVMVMPYTSAGGPSGVAHLAAQFGVPIVSADIGDFRDMADEHEFAIEFFEKSNVESLADALVGVLTDTAKQVEMAEQNFSAAVRMTMPHIMSEYIRTFGWYTRQRQATHTAPLFTRFARWTRTRPARAIGYGMTIVPPFASNLREHMRVRGSKVLEMPSPETMRRRYLRSQVERARQKHVA
jgi:glycosyltransferase involved in cell wall biosynthesis